MKKWYLGWELLLRWDCTPTELLSYLRKGLPAYDDLIDKRILDVGNLRRTAEERSKKTLVLNEITDEEYLNSHAYFENGEDPNTGVMNFDLPSNKNEARNLFEKIRKYRFKQQDVINFEKQHSIHPIEKICPRRNISLTQSSNKDKEAESIHPEKSENPEDFIRSVQIFYVSDTEIKIKIGKNKTKTFSYKDLSYERDNTKGWNTFIQILKSNDHFYHVGVAHGALKIRNKQYDANRDILKVIGKKLVSFLNKTYNSQLPEKFQVFERLKNEHSGTYRPKFYVSVFNADNDHFDNYSKDELIAEIENLSSHKDNLMYRGDEDSEKKLSSIQEKLNAAVMVAIDKKWLARNRAQSYLIPSKKD